MNTMNNKERNDFISGKNEVELTDELIEKIVKEGKWSDVESLKKWRDEGAKWNIVRNSIILTDF